MKIVGLGIFRNHPKGSKMGDAILVLRCTVALDLAATKRAFVQRRDSDVRIGVTRSRESHGREGLVISLLSGFRFTFCFCGPGMSLF